MGFTDSQPMQLCAARSAFVQTTVANTWKNPAAPPHFEPIYGLSSRGL